MAHLPPPAPAACGITIVRPVISRLRDRANPCAADGFPCLKGDLQISLDSGFVLAALSNYDRAASPLADHIKGLIGRLEAM